MRSRDKLKTYLHNHNVFGHHICQGNNVTQGAPTHEFARPLNEVVFWGHVTN